MERGVCTLGETVMREPRMVSFCLIGLLVAGCAQPRINVIADWTIARRG